MLFMWVRWDMFIRRMRSAEFSNRRMEERIGRAFSILGRKLAFQIWQCVPDLRRCYLPGRGTHIARRGVGMLRLMERAAGFIVLRMRERLGLGSTETGYPTASGDGSEWTSILMAGEC